MKIHEAVKSILLLVLCISMVFTMISCDGNEGDSETFSDEVSGEETNNGSSEGSGDELENKYAKALSIINEKNVTEYFEAYKIFGELKDYKDSKNYFDLFICKPSKKKTVYNSEYTEESTIIYNESGNILKETVEPDSGDTEYHFYAYTNGILSMYVECGEYGYSEFAKYSGGSQVYDSIMRKTVSYILSDGECERVVGYDYRDDVLVLMYEVLDEDYDDVTNTVFEYNAEGKIIKETTTKTGSPDYSKVVEHTYDSGKLIKSKETASNDEGTEIITDYEYDENGNLIRKVIERRVYFSSSDKYISTNTDIYTYTYDNNGLLIEESKAGEYTVQYSEFKAFYRNADNKSDEAEDQEALYKSAVLDIENGSYADAYSKFYSLIGYKDSIEYVKKFTLLPTCVVKKNKQDRYTYDDKGNVLTKDILSMGATHTTEYQYDDTNKLISEKYIYDGREHQYTITYTYEGEILISAVKTFVSDGTVQKYEYKYEYDSTGSVLLK